MDVTCSKNIRKNQLNKFQFKSDDNKIINKLLKFYS